MKSRQKADMRRQCLSFLFLAALSLAVGMPAFGQTASDLVEGETWQQWLARLMTGGPAAGRTSAAGGPTFIVTDMYTGSDGLTHLRNKEINSGELEKAAAMVIGKISANPVGLSDWHNAPSWRRYVVALSGRFEVEVSSDGTIKSFGPGDILLAEDTTGKGHKTRAVDGDCVWLFVELGDPPAPEASNGVRNQ